MNQTVNIHLETKRCTHFGEVPNGDFFMSLDGGLYKKFLRDNAYEIFRYNATNLQNGRLYQFNEDDRIEMCSVIEIKVKL